MFLDLKEEDFDYPEVYYFFKEIYMNLSLETQDSMKDNEGSQLKEMLRERHHLSRNKRIVF